MGLKFCCCLLFFQFLTENFSKVCVRGFEVVILNKIFCLELYCLVGEIKMELPLSECVTFASLFWSLDCIFFIVLASCCVWFCLDWELSLRFTVFLRSATRCLYMSRSEFGNFDIAFSGSKFMSCTLFFCFLCKLYLRPFCSRDT